MLTWILLEIRPGLYTESFPLKSQVNDKRRIIMYFGKFILAQFIYTEHETILPNFQNYFALSNEIVYILLIIFILIPRYSKALHLRNHIQEAFRLLFQKNDKRTMKVNDGTQSKKPVS